MLEENSHSVFSPEDIRRGNDRKVSTVSALENVRLTVARESMVRRRRMNSSIRDFKILQKSLQDNEEDLSAMNHSVPLKRIYRSVKRKKSLCAQASAKSAFLSVKEVEDEGTPV